MEALGKRTKREGCLGAWTGRGLTGKDPVTSLPEKAPQRREQASQCQTRQREIACRPTGLTLLQGRLSWASNKKNTALAAPKQAAD